MRNEENTENRIQRILDFDHGRGTGLAMVANSGRRASIKGIDKPTSSFDPKRAEAKVQKRAPYLGNYANLNGLIYPEYDLLEPFTIYDTEVYVKQAIERRIALARKAGWEIVSDIPSNMKNVKYLRTRMAAMEYVMHQTMDSFFEEIWFNMMLCSNCFLWKIRDEKGSKGIKSDVNGNKIPVAAYQIIPPHQILPYLEAGRVKFWRRFFDTGQPYVDIDIDDVIHLKWDVKPSHMFGTPRLTAVRDDIFALRRLEENIELLFVNHLFPLFHVKVGTPEEGAFYGPNGESEVDIIRRTIENMPKEGIFVTDERVAVDSVGAEGSALDTANLISHLKNRVFTGMGVSAVDMGETGATRSSADNVSQNLKDLVKSDLTKFCDMLRMTWFREWFEEAPYQLSVFAAINSVELRFHEIDTDTKIKMENHYTQLYLNNGITTTEFRSLMKRDPLSEDQQHDTNYYLHIRDLALVTASAKANAVAPGAKSVQNKETPTNQHGSNLSPTKAKTSLSRFQTILIDKVSAAREIVLDSENINNWMDLGSWAVDEALEEYETIVKEEQLENSYTIEIRMGIDKLKEMVKYTSDPEILFVLLDSLNDPYAGE